MPVIGDVLAGRYRLDAHIGAGGMAIVYRAFDLRLQRDVALKLLLPNLARDPALARRFEREARVLAAVSHPAVVAIYDVEPGDRVVGRDPFFVMELCPQGSLADALASAGGRLPPDAVVPIIRDAAAGLAALHARDVTHRDVKPANIFLTAEGAKLGDFGLAQAGGMTHLTAPGTALGTIAYLAPEVLSGAGPGPASDVYSLAVTTFEALSGRMPRPSASMADLLDARRAPASPLSSVNSDLRAFDRPLAAGLAVHPTRRPTPAQFAAALATALPAWQSSAEGRRRASDGVAPPPVGTGGRWSRGGQGLSDASTQAVVLPGSGARRRWQWFVGGVVLLGVAGMIAVVALFGGVGRGSLAPTPGPSSTSAASVASGTPVASAVPSPSAVPSATASATASPSPSPSPTPVPSDTASPSVLPSVPASAPITRPPPTPVPSPTPRPTLPPFFDPVQVRQDLQNVRTAIANAVALGNLSGGDAAALTGQADAIERALGAGDRASAGATAAALLSTVDQFINDGRLRSGGELRNWAQMLSQLLPAP